MAFNVVRLTVPRIIGAVLAVLVVASVALAGFLGYHYLDDRHTEQARDDSLAAAKDYATSMFGFDPSNVAAHVARSQSVVTGPAKAQYDKEVTPDTFIKQVRDGQVVSQAIIQEAGVVTNTATTSQVLIFMNQSVSRGGKDLVSLDPSRLTFGMVKQDGRWLINDIEIITDDSFRSRIQQTSTAPSGAIPVPRPADSATPSDSAVPPAPAQTTVPVPTP